MNRNKTVAVAMSGGVDSSVAAALLLKEGYKVIGVTMRLWVDENAGFVTGYNQTPELDAARVAAILGIRHYVFDFRDYFKKTIVDYFVGEYQAGRTPNPCVCCNRKLKFGALFDEALKVGADFIATGHYAKIMEDDEGFRRISIARSRAKDQSYVLYHLGQEILLHTIFPLGDYDKEQVRQMAKEFQLPVFAKKDSHEICFIPDNDHHRFLNALTKEEKGPIVNASGKLLGWHRGISHYTIGQRKGLGIASSQPLFIIKIDAGRNTIALGTASEAARNEMLVKDVTFSNGRLLEQIIPAQVKIRYNAKPVRATITPTDKQGEVMVLFSCPQRGIAPGQSAVFYQGDFCIGGGVIV